MERSVFTVDRLSDRWMLRTPDGDPFLILASNHADVLENERFRDRIATTFGTPESAGRAFAAFMKNAGFNTAGYKPYRTMVNHIPFVYGEQYVDNSFWISPERFSFVDVFSNSFKREVARKTRRCCEKTSANPNLIGYELTDAPRWDLAICRQLRDDDYVSYTRNLDAGSAGKRAYVRFLEERYADEIELFNRRYRMDIRRFDALANHRFSSELWNNAAVRADDEAFLGLISRELNKTIHEAFREYDPNRHLLMGERYKLHDHPRKVLEEAAPFIDILSIQVGCGTCGYPLTPEDGVHDEEYFEGDLLDELHEMTGKPLFIYDHNLSYPTHKHPRTHWAQRPSMEQAVKECGVFMRKAFEKPFVVGYGKCQFPSYVGWSRHGAALKQGIIDEELVPVGDFCERLKQVNEQVLAAAMQRLPSGNRT